MQFCFYPRHEFACPQVGHCPHLGGAALGTLVLAASENHDYLTMLHAQLDAERQRNSALVEENDSLTRQIAQLKLELKVERQSKFADASRKEPSSPPPSNGDDAASQAQAKKRGAPVGHPGWFRPTPTRFDKLVELAVPATCPFCHAQVTQYPSWEPDDHLQEDIVDGTLQVVLYRHPQARCGGCRRWVKQPGEGEILGSRIGPQLRAWAVFLRNEIGISYRKVPHALEELLGVRFTPAALIGFEKLLAANAQPLADDIAKKIGSSDGAVHADETYWRLNGGTAYFWVHGTENYIHFQCDTSRSGQVSRDVLGPHFDGVLVTDCYAGYEAHPAKAKQKCLAHLARTARDWQKVVPADSQSFAFFEAVKTWVTRCCRLHRDGTHLSADESAQEQGWIRAELERLVTCALDHDKAVTLQQRMVKHHDEWLVFLDNPAVPPTNNLAERALRPLVILRKITFGHRSASGAQRMARIMTVQETAKRHGRRPSTIFYKLYTRPPTEVLRYLYAGR